MPLGCKIINAQLDMEVEQVDGDRNQSFSSPSSSASASSSSSSSPSHPQSFASSPSSPKELLTLSSTASSPSSSVLFSGSPSPVHVNGILPEGEGESSNSLPVIEGGPTNASLPSVHQGNDDNVAAGVSVYPSLNQPTSDGSSHMNGDNVNCNTVLFSGECSSTKSPDAMPFDTICDQVYAKTPSNSGNLLVEVIPVDYPLEATCDTRWNKHVHDAKAGKASFPFENGHKNGEDRKGMRTVDKGKESREATSLAAAMSSGHQTTVKDASWDGSCGIIASEQASKPVQLPYHMLSHGDVSMETWPSYLDLKGEDICLPETSPSMQALNQCENIDEDCSDGSRSLQRAQTMPNGSVEKDPVVSSNIKLSLTRSSTDKWKGLDKDSARTPGGSKLSKRKQKELVKMCTVKRDGTVEFDVNGSVCIASEYFGQDSSEDVSHEEDEDDGRTIPSLQIAILIVGTRGDVQPFVAIGKHLQEHGHRVRLATHTNFRDFVLKAGLEFFPLGGDPKVLAGYMVKNKGFLPSGPSEIKTQRKQMKSIINSLLPACRDPYETGVPFRAQAIIANPPALGHIHVAEALKVPLHIFFTMPWTPTSEFSHPLARVHHAAANRISYQVVDSVIWWAFRGMINDFRKKKLKLRPITYFNGSQLTVSKLPTGYIWSPHLVPKPKDWGPKVDVVGFCFLDLAQDYKPPDKLVQWIEAGPAPIYVGFGSLPVEDPKGMTEIIIEALAKTSQRGIISQGWGGIGNVENLPESIYLLDNCPHDWLFPKCAAVIHHGGAGTTAAGLKAACPTTVVPFFGDQPFWGERVYAKGVGPPPFSVGEFTLEKLVHAIQFMLDPQVKQRAIELAEAMKFEDGVVGAVNAFHKHLPRGMPLKAPSIPPKHHKLWSCFGV